MVIRNSEEGEGENKQHKVLFFFPWNSAGFRFDGKDRAGFFFLLEYSNAFFLIFLCMHFKFQLNDPIWYISELVLDNATNLVAFEYF